MDGDIPAVKRLFLILVAWLWTVLPAAAFLPPDASAREPQIRAYRQQVRDNYERRQKERRQQAVEAYRQTQAAVFTPPWMRGTVQTGVIRASGSAQELAAEESAQRKNRLLVSIMLLVLIGSAALWVRHATRRMDEREETSWH